MLMKNPKIHKNTKIVQIRYNKYRQKYNLQHTIKIDIKKINELNPINNE